MMHYNFLVEGEYLDIEQGLSLTFKRENMAFAYGKLKLDRTASFEVPATGKNNRLFKLANNPAREGSGTPMRKKVECYLQAGGVETRGYLYIQSAKRDSYSCVFVSGQFLPLMNLSEMKIKEHTSLKNELRKNGFGSNPDAQDKPCWVGRDNLYPFDYVGENMREYAVMPLLYSSSAKSKNACVNLGFLLSECKDLFGVDVKLPAYTRPEIYEYPPLVAVCPKFPLLDDAEIEVTQDKRPFPAIQNITLRSTLLESSGITNLYCSTSHGGEQQRFTARTAFSFFWKGTKIKFPLDFPDDIFLVAVGSQFDEGVGTKDTQPYMLKFYGGYSFKYKSAGIDTYYKDVETFGTPLAGKEVDIEGEVEGATWSFKVGDKEYTQNNHSLIFVRAKDFRFEKVPNSDYYYCIGLYPSKVERVNMRISQEDFPVGRTMETNDNARFYLSQFVPDISYIDLINVYRYVYGLRLAFDDATQTLSFKPYNITDWNYKNLQSKLMSVDSVKREVEGFGQKNVIEFKQNDNILNLPNGNHMEIGKGLEYKIDNDLIKESNVLIKIPFSSGDAELNKKAVPYFLPQLICNDIAEVRKEDGESEIKERNKEFTIGCLGFPCLDDAGDVISLISRITQNKQYKTLQTRRDLEGLTFSSTKVQAKFKLSLFEFKAIKEDEFIYFGGVRYVWFSGTWSKGVATLTLQKFPTYTDEAKIIEEAEK